VPQGIHIRALRHQKIHNRDTTCVQRRPHQRSVAPLVHVRPMRDHPFRHGQSNGTRGLPRHATFGNPRKRPILAVANLGSVQRRVVSHHCLDTRDVVTIDCLLELTNLVEGLDMSLKLGPTRKPVEARDLELGIGERCRRTRLKQILGLVLQMAEIGTIRKNLKLNGGLLPFPRTGCVLHVNGNSIMVLEIRTAKSTEKG
jgi:hypothetical protein